MCYYIYQQNRYNEIFETHYLQLFPDKIWFDRHIAVDTTMTSAALLREHDTVTPRHDTQFVAIFVSSCRISVIFRREKLNSVYRKVICNVG